MKLLLQSLACAVVLFQLAGCGGPARGTVSGKVTLDDQPVTVGTLMFTNGNSAENDIVTIQSDGTYKSSTVPAGDVKIAVNVPPPNASSMPTGVNASTPPGIPDNPKAKEYLASKAGPGKGFNVPKTYANPDTSNLTVNVAGGSTQTFDIAMKSK